MSRLTSHAAAALDPVRLARQLGMDPDPWQEDALRSDDDRLVLNIHRQGGKSTVAAVKGLHRALYVPGSLVLVISPTERQSKELYRKVLTYYRRLGRPVNAEAENALSLTLENESRVIALPGAEGNVRGYTVDLLIIDEGSRVSDDMFGAVSPMLAVSQGSIVAMSTPWGRRGWWYQATTSQSWRTVTVRAAECPRISAEWLAEERDRIGDFWYRQEYAGEFLDPSGQMFSTDDIDAIFALAGRGGFGDLPALADRETKAVGEPLHPEIAGRMRRRAIRQRAGTVALAARRSTCHHRWGPPSGDLVVCTRCEEPHP